MLKQNKTQLVRSAWCAILCILAIGTAQAKTPPSKTNMDFETYKDLAYVENGHDLQKLDLYVPKSDGTYPLVIWIHGGAWLSGDKKGCQPLGAGFIDRGYAVASLNYRLSGDAIFPAQIEDCKAAIRWLRAHAEEYRLNSDQFGVWGSSAGGHLVALLGTTGEIETFDVGDNLDQSSAVQAVCDYYGPTDFVQMDGNAAPNARFKHDDAQSPESRLIGGPIQKKDNYNKVQSANPITYISDASPAYLIVHGSVDPIVPHHQSELLFEALKTAKIPVRFITVKGGEHGKGFPNPKLNPIVEDFFNRHLKDDTSAAKWPRAMKSSVKATAIEQNEKRPPANANQQNSNRSDSGPPTWEQVLQRSDSNHDGKVSEKEFNGPKELFARLDTNKDGILTENDHNAFVSRR